MLCALLVVPATGGDAPLARRLHLALAAALALLTLASFGLLASRTLEMNGGDASALWADARIALAVTHFGHVWRWRIPALVVAWIAWAWGGTRRGRWALWILVPALALIALTRSQTGHPADHGDLRLAVWIDWLHLLAATAWVGSVLGMSLVVFPRLQRMGRQSLGLAARIFARLSTLSGIALAVLVACGIFNVTQQLGPVDSLWHSAYGITLDVKLALVLAMLLIGAHNRYAKVPRLLVAANLPLRHQRVQPWLPRRWRVRPGSDPVHVLRSCARAVLIESALGIAVIGATAMLVHQMPPADAPVTVTDGMTPMSMGSAH